MSKAFEWMQGFLKTHTVALKNPKFSTAMDIDTYQPDKQNIFIEQ